MTEPVAVASVLRSATTVFGALVVWNLGNFAFFLLAGRALGPSDYGLAAALLAATLVVAVPTQALQFAAARLLASSPGATGEGVYRRAWRACGAATAVAVGAASAVVLGLAAATDADAGPLLATVALVAPLGFFFLALGRLQGEQRFGALALSFALWGVPRPLALLVLAAVGLGVYAALGATAAALMIALAAAVALAGRVRAAHEPSATEWRAFVRPLVPVAASLSGLGLVTNLDVIVAKLALGAQRAGEFAAAATLAKAVFLVPQALSFVLLPRVAARAAADRPTGPLVGAAVGATLLVGGLAALVGSQVAEPLLRMTYGHAFVGSADVLAPYIAASTLVGALIVVINHHIARGADRFVWGAVAVAVAHALLLTALHDSERTIIGVVAVTGAAGLVLHELMFFRSGEAIVPGVARTALRLRSGR